MKLFRYGLLYLLLVVFLAACGGGGGGGSAPAAIILPPADPVGLSGAAIKGVVADGVVAAHEIDSSGVAVTTALETTTTDQNGDYSLTLPSSFSGGPLLLRLTANVTGTTTMKCDVAAGCGNAAFGETFVVPSNFELSAVLGDSSAGDEVTVNLTALTTLAAKYAASKSGGLTTENIEAANTQVADTFGLTGDINQFTPVDLTDPDDVAAADSDAILNALYSAGILAALLDDGRDVADGLNNLAQEFADQDGNLMVNDTGFDSVVISLLEILEGAQAVIDIIDEGDATIAAIIAMALADAVATTPGEFSNGEPSPNVGDTKLNKAKAMVNDVRTIGAATTVAAVETGAVAFQDQIRMAGDLIDQDTTDTVEVLENVFAAMGATIDSLDFAALTLPFTQTFSELGGVALGFELSVEITETSDQLVLTLAVDDVVNGVDVAVSGTATLSGAIAGLKSKDPTSLDGLTIDVTGSAGKGGLSLTIDRGDISLQAANLGVVAPGFDRLDARLDITLIQEMSAEVSDPISFEGLLAFTVNVVEGIEETEGLPSGRIVVDISFMFETAAFTLQGTFSDTMGQSVSASLAVNLDGDGFVAGVLPLGFHRNMLSRYEVSADLNVVDFFYTDPLFSATNDVWRVVRQDRTEFFTEERLIASGESVSSVFESSYTGGPVIKYSAFDGDGNEVYPFFNLVGNEPLLVPLSLFGPNVAGADSAVSLLDLDALNREIPLTQIVNGEGMYALEWPVNGLNPAGGTIGGVLVCKRECGVLDANMFPVTLAADFLSHSVDNVLLGGVALGFSVSLSGIEERISITVSATRTAFHRGEVDVNFNFGGRRFTMNAPIDLDAVDTAPQQLRVLNQDLVELRITIIGTEVSGEMSILGDDEVLATVTRENGVVIVRYNDDTFETFP